MNFQLNFTISPQKEKELFAFHVKECDCSILKGYGADKDFTVDICNEPSLYLYVIVPRNFVNIIRIDPCCDQELGANFSIYPFDESGRNFPLIRYERFEGLYRIYGGTANMYGTSRTEIKAVQGKIKNGSRQMHRPKSARVHDIVVSPFMMCDNHIPNRL